MPNLWFSYSTIFGLDAPQPPNSPYSLTWNIGRFLRDKATALDYTFRYVNLDDCGEYAIGADDICVGHVWWPDGFMNRALASPARLKFVLQPYSPGMVAPTERDWIRLLFGKADHLFLVTGPAWYDAMPDGPFADWQAKATRLDMAIDVTLHPHSKRRWNPPGKRALLAIGADTPAKGLDIVADFARIGGFKLGHFGAAAPGRFQHVPQAIEYGGVDFDLAGQQHITDEYDGFISLARMDANPTTLLETAAWGLVPFCNVESGYHPGEPFLELRLDDMRFNLEVLDWFQRAPEYELRCRADAIQREVVEQHTWARFCETLWAEISKWL